MARRIYYNNPHDCNNRISLDAVPFDTDEFEGILFPMVKKCKHASAITHLNSTDVVPVDTDEFEEISVPMLKKSKHESVTTPLNSTYEF